MQWSVHFEQGVLLNAEHEQVHVGVYSNEWPLLLHGALLKHFSVVHGRYGSVDVLTAPVVGAHASSSTANGCPNFAAATVRVHTCKLDGNPPCDVCVLVLVSLTATLLVTC